MKKFTLFVLLLVLVQVSYAQTKKGSFSIGLHNYSPGPLTSDVIGINLFPQTNGLGISFGTAKVKYDGEDSEDKVNSTVFGLSFSTHYFVADQFALGMVGSFSSSSVTSHYFGNEYKSSGTIFLVSPEVRYYFDTGEKTKLWLKGGAGVGSIGSKDDGESNDPIKLSQYGGGAGVSIFPVAAVSIDFGLGYNVLTLSDKSGSGDYKSINGSLNFDIGFGFFF